MSPKKRSKGDLTRRLPSKYPRERVLIVCEGARTEPLYFNAIRKEKRLSSLQVEVHGQDCGTDPKSVVNFAVKLMRDAERSSSNRVVPYDAIFCVIDTEVPPRQGLDEAFSQAQNNGIQMILSNPCFEFWYLLHFHKTARHMQSSDECTKLLKQHYGGYSKTLRTVWDHLSDRLGIAKSNALAVIREMGWDEYLKDCNPSTHVFRVVDRLKQIQE